MNPWTVITHHPLVLLAGYWGRRRLALIVALHVLLVLSALLVAWYAQQSRNLYGELHQLQGEHDELLQRQAQLLVERGMHADLTRVERVAREQLAMHFPVIVADGTAGVWLAGEGTQ